MVGGDIQAVSAEMVRQVTNSRLIEITAATVEEAWAQYPEEWREGLRGEIPQCQQRQQQQKCRGGKAGAVPGGGGGRDAHGQKRK